MRRLAVHIAALLLGAQGAAACDMIVNETARASTKGTCGITHYETGIDNEGLQPAKNLGGGFVGQVYFEGHSCGASLSMAVTDCSTGQAAIFGPSAYIDHFFVPEAELAAWRRAPYAALAAAIERAAAQGRPMPLAEIAGRARGHGMRNAALVPVRGKAIGISNRSAAPRHRYDLSCGCRAFYPGSAGGS